MYYPLKANEIVRPNSFSLQTAVFPGNSNFKFHQKENKQLEL